MSRGPGLVTCPQSEGPYVQEVPLCRLRLRGSHHRRGPGVRPGPAPVLPLLRCERPDWYRGPGCPQRRLRRRRGGLRGVAHGIQEAYRRHVPDHRLAGRRPPRRPRGRLATRALRRPARGEPASQAHPRPRAQARRRPGVHGRAPRQARTLAQASVVDGTELRRDADSIAEQIADTQDDAAAYAREALPVDEALVEQAIEADRANG